jgi:hypothetical protein
MNKLRFYSDSQMRSIYSPVALCILLAALLLVAGCVTSPGSDDKTQIIPKEKYVFFEHHINTNGVTITGDCAPRVWIDFPFYFFDENSGVLTVTVHPDDPVNDSLILFYGSGKSLSGVAGQGAMTSAVPVYALPKSFSENVTLDSITADGTVTFHYNTMQLSLKPNESWENTTRVMEHRSPPNHRSTCTAEIITTDRFHNAGFFDKKTIVLRILSGG